MLWPDCDRHAQIRQNTISELSDSESELRLRKKHQRRLGWLPRACFVWNRGSAPASRMSDESSRFTFATDRVRVDMPGPSSYTCLIKVAKEYLVFI
jgi:hypothetical protein